MSALPLQSEGACASLKAIDSLLMQQRRAVICTQVMHDDKTANIIL